MSEPNFQESWLEIKQEPDYFVSNLGRVRRPCGRVLSKRLGGYKRNYIRAGIRNRDYYVHRLVLEAFVGPCPSDRHEASHIDGNSFNNNLENLAWETVKKNNKRKIDHGTSGKGEKNASAKLYDKDVLEIRNMFKSGISSSTLSYMYNVSDASIKNILKGNTFKHIKISDSERGIINKLLHQWMATSSLRSRRSEWK